MQEEQDQTLEACSDATQSVTGSSNDTDTCIWGTSVGDAEKAGRKADSVQSIENRQSYKIKEEKLQFICESFQLDTNQISNADEKLKEAVIILYLDNFEVLATNPSQYIETKVLEMKIDLIPGAIYWPKSMSGWSKESSNLQWVPGCHH